MLQRSWLVFMLLTHAGWHIKASARFNHLNSITSGTSTSGISSASVYDNQQQTWQPRAPHSNWIILQTTTAANSHNYDARALTHGSTHRYTYGANNDFELQRLPVNYYAYNHSTGNYQPPLPAASPPTHDTSLPRVVPPYVLAISDLRRRAAPLVGSDASSLLQDNSFVMHAETNKNSNSNNNNNNHIAFNKESVNDNINMPPTHLVRQPIDSNSREEDVVESGNNLAADRQDAEMETALNELLLPLESAMDRMKHWCDVVKRIISHVDEDNTDNNESSTTPSSVSATVTATATATSRAAVVPPSVSAEVQGRHNIATQPHSLAASSTLAARLLWPTPVESSNTLPSVGVGRKVKKLKRKLKKLLLPLLIAYKLKFLTLIPVLIGGLTLLVGTTGLAGFFFALFTAVMSLKTGGGSKSIVVKKI